MDGILLTARMLFILNFLGKRGPDGAHVALLRHLSHNHTPELRHMLLDQFPETCHELNMVATSLGVSWETIEVTRAYWFGSGENSYLTSLIDLLRAQQTRDRHQVQELDRARVSWGTVISKQDDLVFVRRQPLQLQQHLLVLGQEEAATVAYRAALTPALQPGDCVAIIWGFVPLVLTPEEQTLLIQSTNSWIEQMNEPFVVKKNNNC